MERHLTYTETARILGRSPRYVRRLVESGQVRSVQVGRRRYVVWRGGLVWESPEAVPQPRPANAITPSEVRARRRALRQAV